MHATRTATLAVVAALAGAVAVADPVRGARQSPLEAAVAAWNGIFGERPAPSAAERMIVVLDEPSLADRIGEANTPPTPREQKRWVAAADAAQRAIVGRLRERGIRIRRERSFTRTLNGFSALVDARAQAELERMDAVAGVYPARTVYPAEVTTEALARPEFRAGGGRRAEPRLPGFDGRGVRIALLDSGVDLDHPALKGRVLPGLDLVDRDRRAAAEPKPDDPSRVEAHATRMAGILVAARGPASVRGVVPAARVLPIRVIGWERADDGAYSVFGRGDTLLAGLERAVDPDGDGHVGDAVPVALAAVMEPYASFADSPESRAVAGASRLGTLVVAPAGNDGRGGPGFGTVGAPGGAAEALTVGALDARRETLEVDATLRVGGDSQDDLSLRVVGVVAPTGALPAAALLGPSLGDPERGPDDAADGTALEDFFDQRGVSRVAGRAALLPAGGGSLEEKVANAATAGAAAVVVHGNLADGGSLDLDAATAVPVVALPEEAGRAVVAGLKDREPVTLSFADVRGTANETHDEVAAFSSGGISFGGHVKPDVVAPGVGIATADGGRGADGAPRYATVTGSSAAAAIVAGAAGALVEARPGLGAAQLRSLLVGTARQLVGDGAPAPVTVQGAGAVDPAAAVAAEIAVEPATLAFGRAEAERWTMTHTVTVHNLATRPIDVTFGIARDRPGDPKLEFSAEPAGLTVPARASSEVTLMASASGHLAGEAGGAFVVTPEGSPPIRVPWALSFRESDRQPLLADVALSHHEFEPSDVAPAVLAFRVGDVVATGEGRAVEPVELLVAQLWTARGRRVGVLARLRDLLPGQYAFGMTGRGPGGKILRAGDYVVRLRAHPVAGEARARPTTVNVPFTVTDDG